MRCRWCLDILTLNCFRANLFVVNQIEKCWDNLRVRSTASRFSYTQHALYSHTPHVRFPTLVLTFLSHASKGIAMGVGVVVGPLLASAVTQCYGPRAPFVAVGIIGMLNAGMLTWCMDEPLEDEKRKPPMELQDANPFSFTRLFTSGYNLAAVTAALGLQCLAEPRFVFPYVTLCWRTKYKYDAIKIGRLASVFGLMYIVGALVAKRRMKSLGPRKHATESNLANILAFLAWSKCNGTAGTLLSYALFVPGVRKRDGLEVLGLDLGLENGWGKGEISGMVNNFKSVSAVFAPLMMAKAYAATTTNGRNWPGSPMAVCAAVTLLAEAVLRMSPSLATVGQAGAKQE
eukprot:m.279893 g.279893  ORF g.279893 m.279893 type:complete len:345 (+) comp19817_c1_seq1:1001-2035(+)